MSGTEKQKTNPRKVLIILLAILILILAVLIVIPLLLGEDIGVSWYISLFIPRAPEVTATEFPFDIGSNRSFVTLGRFVAGVGTRAVEVYDSSGEQTMRTPVRLSRPAISATGDTAIAFDLGGTAAIVFDSRDIVTSVETTAPIVSAYINPQGRFCIVIQEGGGSRGTVMVHDERGYERFRVTMGTGFVLSAKLSHDGNSLAILNYTNQGSRITFYNDLSEDRDFPDAVFNYYDGIIVDFFFLRSGDIIAITVDAVLLIDNTAGYSTLFSYPDSRLAGYTFSEDTLVLHLYDYLIGYSGRLISMSSSGTLHGERSTSRAILSMSFRDNTLVTLQHDSLTFFSQALEALPIVGDVTLPVGANNALLLLDTVAMVANDHSTIVVDREGTD